MRVSTLLLAACAVFAPLATFGRSSHHHSTSAAAAATVDVIDASNIATAFAEMQSHADWQHFKTLHKKRYATPHEEAHRFSLFQRNMEEAKQLNLRNPEAVFGMTPFSDMDAEEFKRLRTGYKPSEESKRMKKHAKLTRSPKAAVADMPVAFDWRLPNDGRATAVTPVKDQGNCGSCWAFSTTEATESAFIMAGNPMTELAVEQLVECDQGDGGCHGGDTTVALGYVKSFGLEASVSIPYISGANETVPACAYEPSLVVAKITGYTFATPPCTDGCVNQNEELLQQNLYNSGPVSVCVDSTGWRDYVSGIMTWTSGCTQSYDNLDHCVQLVGYGVDHVSGMKFWSVRNSWTDTWGEAGYIRLAYGNNTCGFADSAIQATIPHV